MIKIDVSELPVMAACCKTCPFRDIDGKWQDVKIANEVVARTLFKAHQICHGTETGAKRKPHNRCKGAFDHNSEIYRRMGFGEFIK